MLCVVFSLLHEPMGHTLPLSPGAEHYYSLLWLSVEDACVMHELHSVWNGEGVIQSTQTTSVHFKDILESLERLTRNTMNIAQKLSFTAGVRKARLMRLC